MIIITKLLDENLKNKIKISQKKFKKNIHNNKFNIKIKSNKMPSKYIRKSLNNKRRYWKKSRLLVKKASKLLFARAGSVLKLLRKKRKVQRQSNYEYLKKLKYFNSRHNKYLKNKIKTFRFGNVKIKDFI
jgi:hypothetical protein